MSQEIKLATNYKEREEYDQQANLYAILTSLELLERAHIRDSVDQDEYYTACAKLLGQFKTVSTLLERVVPDVGEFAKKYKLSCSAALARIKVGTPSIFENSFSTKNSNSALNPKYVAQVVQTFITIMDYIKLNMVAVDELHPILSDLVQYLEKLTSLPKDYTGKPTITRWLISLNNMKASDKLDDEQIRELHFDLEKSYNEFLRFLDEN